MRLAAVLVVLALIGPAARAQQPPPAPSPASPLRGIVTNVGDEPLSSRGTRVTIAEGHQRDVTLRLIRR